MKYFLYLIGQILCTLLCYLTNWLVVLFADEEGELHGFLHYWQTWDSTLDNKDYVERYGWGFLKYDYDKYFKQDEVLLEEGDFNRKKFISKVINPNIPISVRIKRYLSRVCWLYRNNAYGFAYYFFSVRVCPTKLVYIWKKVQGPGKHGYLIYEKGHTLWNTPWAFYDNRHINKYMDWCNYLGWKIVREPGKSPDEKFQCMLANRIAIHGYDND